MRQVDLPAIRSDKVQERSYQIHVFNEIKDHNALVVLPTGLGKTIIAILMVAYQIQRGRVLFLAPTKPLCEQHAASIANLTTLEPVLVTGELYGPDERHEVYRDGDVIVATPQTVENDLDRGINPGDFRLIVFDEAHRAIGSYAYVGIARRYLQRGSQTLGMTASPGSDYNKLQTVAANLGVEKVALRTEQDSDVKPYLAQRNVRWELMDMPEEIKYIARRLDRMLNDFLADLRKYTRQAQHLSASKLSKKVLIDIQQRMRIQLGKRGGTMYSAISVVSAAIKLSHLKDMLTSQGVEAAQSYIAKIEFDKSKAAANIRKHSLYPSIRRSIITLEGQRPKLDKTIAILQHHFKEHPEGRVILFAEYRDTVDFLLAAIEGLPPIRARKFIGQARGAGDGMSQEEQKETLQAFRNGDFNVLVSTSIGEEGIDIPATTLVVFYEPVPSAIRTIQRRGRTARDGVPGKVVVLIMKGSRDEAYYWSSHSKEKKMYQQIARLKQDLDPQSDQPSQRHLSSEKTSHTCNTDGQTMLDNF